MELLKEILIRALEDNQINFIGLDKIIENRCYKTLEEIIKIIRSPNYDDTECFFRIEQIICTLETLGTNAAKRHDFT